MHHETKKHGIRRFAILAAVVLVYTGFVVYQHGVQDGLAVAALTWSLFVLATPVADAGFLIGFPLRLLLGIRMLHSQIGVWSVAIAMNIVALSVSPAIYETTALLGLFYTILTTPWPLWGILAISAFGSWLSIKFEDDAIDIATSKTKKQLLRKRRRADTIYIGLLLVAIALYAATLYFADIDLNIA